MAEIYKLIYKIDKLKIYQNYLRILGNKFFHRNKYIGKIGRIIINNKVKPLKDTISMEIIKENEVIIKIIFFQKIRNKSCMFKECQSLLSFFHKENYYKKKKLIEFPYEKNCNNPLSNNIFSYVSDISEMFSGCISLISLPDIYKWNTSNITDMSGIFHRCSSLISLPDISKWNTNNVIDMNSMFSYCESLISLPDISKWNTNKVFDMSFMFYNCKSLISLPDISIWNIEKVKDIYCIFSDCPLLTSIPDLNNDIKSDIIFL